jgi:hypothetical protein
MGSIIQVPGLNDRAVYLERGLPASGLIDKYGFKWTVSW